MFSCVKLIGYFASAVNAVSSDPCVGPSPRINISVFSLYHISSKNNDICPMLPSVNENSEQKPNPMLQPLYLYLPGSAFLVSFTDANEQLFNVKSVFKFLNHGFSV